MDNHVPRAPTLRHLRLAGRDTFTGIPVAPFFSRSMATRLYSGGPNRREATHEGMRHVVGCIQGGYDTTRTENGCNLTTHRITLKPPLGALAPYRKPLLTSRILHVRTHYHSLTITGDALTSREICEIHVFLLLSGSPFFLFYGFAAFTPGMLLR